MPTRTLVSLNTQILYWLIDIKFWYHICMKELKPTFWEPVFKNVDCFPIPEIGNIVQNWILFYKQPKWIKIQMFVSQTVLHFHLTLLFCYMLPSNQSFVILFSQCMQCLLCTLLTSIHVSFQHYNYFMIISIVCISSEALYVSAACLIQCWNCTVHEAC